ncbi:hypothetical protein [uncultured Polaribacter sp.]|uniref:hypothetical protein n=1 Tax=uncultured Polaribacter sp. TaxID=174711 RepID=UPI00260E65ED|nr:hypothetical protein [uncultured Polaribacter sp.]
MLFISAVQIVVLFFLLLIPVVYALILASREQHNMRFLIWGAIILFVPFLGALACILNYHLKKRTAKTT